MDEQRTCACGCGATVKKRGKSGPAPIYATSACRMRALRNRRLSDELTPLPDIIRDAPVIVVTGNIEDQVHRAVIEARALGFAFSRLGRQARPELAWRCARLGELLIQGIEDNFGEGN